MSESEAEHLVVEDAFEAFKNDPIHRRHMELSRATVEHPEDASAWLALVEYQPILFKAQNSSEYSTLQSSRSLADMKISLYEQALSHVEDSDRRNALILGLMQEGSKVWDTAKQVSQWQAVLGRDSSPDLWILYVNFIQSNPVKFSFDGCFEIYRQWFQTLKRLPNGRDRDSCYIYALIRATMLLWQAGFTERAIGVWQAVLEYNFFRPPDLSAEELLPAFERFWESEVARIGETGSYGWNSGTSAEAEARSDKRFQTNELDLPAWAVAETELEHSSGLPARALDDIDEDDPFRMLLFSDVQDFLFSPTTTEGLKLLEDGFLLFVGLPRASALPESRQWDGDPFIHNVFHATNSPLYDDTPDDGIDFDLRFADVFCASKYLETHHSVPARSCFVRAIAVYFNFSRRVISQLAERAIQKGPDELMVEYLISLEAGIDMKATRKLVKSLLKRKSDSLGLYDAYATLEAHLGNQDAGERVWSTALSMRLTLGQDAEANAFFLWRSWAYSYMRQKRFHQARLLLSMIPNANVDSNELHQDNVTTQGPSAANTVKVEQYIKRHVEASRLRRHCQAVPAMIDVLAFHKYLNDNLRIGLALEAYDYGMKMLASAPRNEPEVLQRVHEQRARFIYAHVVTFGKEFKPSDLTAILQGSLQKFPDNSTLFTLGQYFAQRSGIIERLRQLDRRPTEKANSIVQTSVIPCVFEMLAEVHRPSYAGSTDHSIRSMFHRVTEVGSAGHNCLGIWKDFCLWEMSVASREPKATKLSNRNKEQDLGKKIKEAYYASLRACPWSKELCMLAFTQGILRECLGEAGLKYVYQNMLDRGMRLHLDISDRLL